MLRGAIQPPLTMLRGAIQAVPLQPHTPQVHIQPLLRRALLHRFDVFPFLLAYSTLMAVDVVGSSNTAGWVVDLGYILVLVGQLVLFLKGQWDPRWNAWIAFQTVSSMSLWTHCLIVPPSTYENREVGGIVPVSILDDGVVVAVVHFRGWTYRCCQDGFDGAMEEIWKMEEEDVLQEIDEERTSMPTPHFHRLQFPVDLPLPFYTTWTGHDSKRLVAAWQIYGRNVTPIPLPPILSLLSQQLLQPLFLFQLFCVLLWSLDEYWMYALFTLFSLVMFEWTMAYHRWKGVKRLREEVDSGAVDPVGILHNQRPTVECYRNGKWMVVQTNELVVGDVVSLVSSVGMPQMLDHEQGTAVPADLLLLRGRAVVNEAMLTGESVPQVKESIRGDLSTSRSRNTETTLDVSRGHKRSVLFGGTVLMDHHIDENDGNQDPIPQPPNKGLVCFVLRTGFDTIQGSLLRSLAYRAESGGRNAGGGEGVNSSETFIFLALLLLFALVSASTVVQHAWGDVTRNHFKLLLHVIIIITSVIPPELPMELSLAVTTSLSELVKRCQVYCTEPFRIPLAGLVDTCCFDKTGTLTSDELRLHGVCLPVSNQESNIKRKAGEEGLILLNDITSDNENGVSLPRETLRVMVGCQSLAVTHAFIQGSDGKTMVTNKLVGDPLEKAVLEACSWTLLPGGKDVVVPLSTTSQSMQILHRFAFSSTLRRMSVLAVDNGESISNGTNGNNTLWALTKGSPETIKPLLHPKSVDSDIYTQLYKRQMALGRRVLALAYQNLGKNTTSNIEKWKSSRDEVERNLIFAGLLIMDSPLKPDTSRIIKELRAGKQNTVMVTGDAALTAAEVARRVGIIDAPENATYELCYSEKVGFRFVPLNCFGDDKEETCFSYTTHDMEKLSILVQKGEAAVCMTGEVLSKITTHAIQLHDGNSPMSIKDHAVLNHPAARRAIAEIVPIVSVFARHEPMHKEAIVSAFNSIGRHTLMCGDGSNDIGALKAAHVGVSIISVPDLECKQRDALDAIKSKTNKKSRDKKSKRAEMKQVDGYLKALAEAEDELQHVNLGNASVASPFTARKTSIRCCKDILQQGRCTLVTMIQIYKILGVNCLVTALVLTKLHQAGVKQGDRQMTAQGIVIAGLFLFVTRGKPISKLSKQKPPSSILSITTLISMTAQFVVHFATIMAVTCMSETFVDPYDPSMVPDGPFVPNTLNTSTFLVTMLVMINTFVVNYAGRPFVENLNENRLLFRSIVFCYFVLFVCAMDIFPPLNQLLQLSSLPSQKEARVYIEGSLNTINQAAETYGFRTLLSALMCLDTACVMAFESLLRKWSGRFS